MGTILRNALQVLAFAIACAPLGVLLWPVYGWMLPVSGGSEGGAALELIFSGAIVGMVGGVIVGLYSLGLFQRAKRSAIRDVPVACLRCGHAVSSTESRCANCGWTWDN
jgi:hypothetical protein